MTPVELNGYAPHFRKALETVRDQAAARARQEVLASIGEAFVRQAMAAMGGGMTVATPDLFAKAAQHSPAGGATIAAAEFMAMKPELVTYLKSLGHDELEIGHGIMDVETLLGFHGGQ